MGMFSLQLWQGQRPAGATSAVVTSSSSHMVSQQSPPASLRGVTSGYQSSVEYNAGRMKSIYMPGSSTYDLSSSVRTQTSPLVGDGGEHTESHPFVGSSMNTVGDKQVLGPSCLELIWFQISIYWYAIFFTYKKDESQKLNLRCMLLVIARSCTKQLICCTCLCSHPAWFCNITCNLIILYHHSVPDLEHW